MSYWLDEESSPISEEDLERLRTGQPLDLVGRIDLRERPDRLSLDAISNARYEHRLRFTKGHLAPIRIRERQVEWLAISLGYGAEDEDGNPRDFSKPGSTVFGHELWVDPDPDRDR